MYPDPRPPERDLTGVMTEDGRTRAAAAAAGDLPAHDRLVASSADPARRVARRLVDDPDAVEGVEHGRRA